MQDLKQRTCEFALRVIRWTEALPRNRVGEVIGRQLLRSGTSVGANYRAECRAKPNADFIAKLGIVEEELDESAYWMELREETGMMKLEKLQSLKSETDELLAIIVTSIKTARKNRMTTHTRFHIGVAKRLRNSALRIPHSAFVRPRP